MTLIAHEAGHAAFMWSGSRLWTVAGGTLFQLAIPMLTAWLFWRQSDVFAITVALFWLGTSLVDADIYAADAVVQLLPAYHLGEERTTCSAMTGRTCSCGSVASHGPSL